MSSKNSWTADFETTTNLNDCRVWAWAVCKIGEPETFNYDNNLDSFMKWCEEKENASVYFHNLKFDGEFIMNWLFKNGFEYIEDRKERRSRTFTTLISGMGQFYSIEIFFKVSGKHVVHTKIYDSLKILNFSVENIAKDFNLPIQKLKLNYDAYRSPDHKLTAEEVHYINHDVKIMALALDIMFKQNLKKMTIGSDALADYKTIVGLKFKRDFPVLSDNIDGFLRMSYKGGFTYLNEKYKGKQTGKGIVFDMNSMYPSKMKYEKLPFGYPLPFTGKYESDPDYPLFIIHIECEFELKDGKIPSIQIKKNRFYVENEYLKDSGGLITELYLTSVDLDLFFENYNIKHLKYIGGYKFHAKTGMFSSYIDKWTESKIKAKKEKNSSLYRISKLMLNSLYGKFGTNPRSRKKIPYYDGERVRYKISEPENRDSIYVAVAAFITSYARADIIRSSENIREYSLSKYGFDAYVYSDTDSIHCLLDDDDIEELSKNMKIDDFKLGYWKLESRFTRGKYIRQKCYIEEFDGKIAATVAGMPKRLGRLLNFDNFKIGFTTEGYKLDDPKLSYSHVAGGIVLTPTDFTIK